MKKSISVLLLSIFSIISWIIWIIEVNPFSTNTWDWIDEKRITFVVTPILFLLWAYLSRLITKIPKIIVNLIIFYIFFVVILCLIMIAHIAGPSGALILFSPFRFLLYKPISLILISLLTFGFNFFSFKIKIASRFVRNFSEKSHSNQAAFCSFSKSIFCSRGVSALM